jgi:N-methylhydantoinase B
MVAYFRPTTLEEALQIRSERNVVVLAGGTDIYPAKAARVGWGDMRHPDVLDISAIKDLRKISEEGDRIRFGALTTWTDLKRAELPPAFDGYKVAARQIGGAQVQNRGTLVGNICTASPAGDGIPCLMTLDAEVELLSLRGSRVIGISDFFVGYRKTVLRPDEIVSAISMPKLARDARGSFVKLGARRYLVISIAMAAAILMADEDGTITAARIAVGACTPVALRLGALEQALIGHRIFDAPRIVAEEHFSALSPIDDIRASALFRTSAAVDLVRDLLAGFSGRAERRAA